MKKIIVLNGSFCEQPIIVKAKEMGFYVVTTGNMPELMGHAYADEYIPCDYSDKKAVLDIVRENNIEGIVSCANDFGTLTASYVGEAMGWSGHDPYETASIIHHKDRFKRFCYENDIRSPYSRVFYSREEGYEYVKGAEYPVIVKATDLTGGKGISRADNEEEARKAIDNAIRASRRDDYIIEPYITGKQQAFVVFIVDGKAVVDYSTSCFSPVNPYLIQYETMPAEGIEYIRDELLEDVRIMTDKLKLVDGIICLQYIVKDNKPYVIESMRRCFGNQFLTLATAFTGYPWEEAYIRASLGDPGVAGIVPDTPRFKNCGYFGVMSGKKGLLTRYHLPDDIEKHIFNRVRMIKEGERINDHLQQRVEFLHFQYDDYDEMCREVARYNDRIIVEVK
ncbi:MAG: hypothetical protein K6F34_05615 [Lachnospiraceae bacterium]|nr:hypothetical protein [Lachnospiraceae bacterium]